MLKFIPNFFLVCFFCLCVYGVSSTNCKLFDFKFNFFRECLLETFFGKKIDNFFFLWNLLYFTRGFPRVRESRKNRDCRVIYLIFLNSVGIKLIKYIVYFLYSRKKIFFFHLSWKMTNIICTINAIALVVQVKLIEYFG